MRSRRTVLRPAKPGRWPALLLAGLLVLTGCATVPTSGEIRNGSKDGPAAAGGNGVGVQAKPPRRDVAPAALVAGFLEAMSDFGGFDTAREYMTPDAAAQWKPEGSPVSVYDQSSPTTVSRGPGGVVQLRAPLVGTIDQRGSWSPAARTATVSFDFRVVQVDGQNRVASVPAGVYLGSNKLEPLLAPYPLYFTNRDRDVLVPDPVFVPRYLSPGQVATRLVTELLKGPTSRLATGAGTAAPAGTQVNVSVPVENGTATVELSDAAAGIPEDGREALAAQIMWTLRPISTRVKITVAGARLLPEPNPEILQFADFARYDPAAALSQMTSLYGLRAGKVQRIALDGSGPVGPRALDDSMLSLYSGKAFAVSLLGTTGALVTRYGGRPSVLIGPLESSDDESELGVVPTEGDVLRPSFDKQDTTWILDRAGTTPRLRIRTRDGQVADVRTDFQGQTPLSLRMAPDGVRALMLMRGADDRTFVQTGTVTTEEGGGLRLTQLRRLELPLTDITDVTWHGVGILVAGRPQPDAVRQPWLVNTDGSQPRPISGSQPTFEAVGLASNSNLDTLPVVIDSRQRIHWQTKDLAWADLDDDPPVVVTPVYPG